MGTAVSPPLAQRRIISATYVNHNATSTGNFTGWSAWQSISNSGTSTTSHTLTGLTNGKEYRYHLRAVNAAGPGSVAPNAHPWFVSTTPAPPSLSVSNITENSVTLEVLDYSGQ